MTTRQTLVFRFAPMLAMVGFVLIFGYNWVVMKVGVADIPPFASAAARALIGAATLFVVMLAMRRSLRPPAWRPTVVVGLLQTTGMLALATWAVVSGPSGKAAVLVNSMPLWIPLFAWPLLGERVGARWTAIVVGVLGMALMIDPRSPTGWLSDLSGLCAAVVWAAAAVVTRQAHHDETFDPLSFTAWQVLIGSVPLIALALIVRGATPLLTTSALLSVAYNGVLATGLAFALFTYAIKRLPSSAVGAASLSVPIVGVAAAWLQLGERPSALEWSGMACVVGALYLMAHPVTLRRTRSPELALPPHV
ncbi:MAG TPA: DMT family transporter [Candidatus Sulfotelmatobacter sp.]|nr:DMT family transporter [Candidatus Sulfotelmatobacter sp.]